MARELKFSALDRIEAETEKGTHRMRNDSSWRSKRREDNPLRQTSFRIRQDVLDRFHQLCAEERRSHGDMVEHMMNVYAEALKQGWVKRF